MSDRTITRRRIVQGIGTVGVAGLVGGPVSAQTENGTGETTTADEDTAAIRVAHAVADAPAVDVRLTATGDTSSGTDTDGTATDGNATADDTATDGNATADGTATDRAAENEISITGLGFGGVTDYRSLDPGSYRLELVATEDGLVDQIIDIFEGDSEDETVVFQETVEVESGTSYTAVAFGEIAEGPAGGGTETTSTDTDEPTDETDGDSADTASLTISDDRGLQVDVLEDDLTAPGDEMARVRVFHAVPDAGPVTITTVSDEGAATDGGVGATETDGSAGATETDGSAGATEDDQSQVGAQSTLVDTLAFGESQTFDVEAGSYTLEVTQSGGATDGEETATGETTTDESTDANGTAGGDEMTTRTGEQGGPPTVEVDLDAGGVYTGFAVGYFDPEAAAGLGVSTATDETATDGDTESPGQETDGDRAERVIERGFELVTVKDSQDGDRVAGGNRGLL